jgi:uroporphyrinogen decarboxylase
MDVLEVRKEYGRDLRMWYGVDKRVLASGNEAIDAELERIRPLVEDGGYVPGTDHSLPPDVSYENYCYYMERFLDVYGS